MAWYNSAWTKRKKITLTGTGDAQTDYQMKFVVTYDTDMKSDFSDLRFTKLDGTTLIDAWLESKIDITSAVVWVKTDTPANTIEADIYMYYGNSVAASDWDGSETFEIFDDFDSDSTIAVNQTTKDTVYDTTRYALAPIVIKLHDGTLFAVFCEGDAHGSQNNHDVKWINSTDDGVTWSTPQVVALHDGIIDARNSGVLEFDDAGTWTILVYYDKQTSLVGNVKCKKSTNGGQSWGSEITVTTNDDRYTYGTGVEMANGDLIFASYSWNSGCAAYVEVSGDGGDTWTEYLISSISGMSETSIANKTTNGHVLASMRKYPTGEMWTATSIDYGQTWGVPVNSGISGADAPVTITRLSNGDIIAAWENSNLDFRFAISKDDGVTWNTAGSYSVYYDGTMPANAGYITTVQINDNEIYCLFYRQHATGHADIFGNLVNMGDCVWNKTGSPSLSYSSSILHLYGTDNTDHRLSSMEQFSDGYAIESRSMIDWTGLNNAQLGFGLFIYDTGIPGYVGDFAVVKDRSSADALSHFVNSDGSATAQYTDGSNMNSYFINKILWETNKITNVYTGGSIIHTTYIPDTPLSVIIGGHGYASGAFDMYLDWLFVRKYVANSATYAFGSEESAPTAGNSFWYYYMLKRRNQ